MAPWAAGLASAGVSTEHLRPQLAIPERLDELMDLVLQNQAVLVAVPERPDGAVASLAQAVCALDLPAGVVVFTSGSTGTPRAVHLPTSALVAAATACQQQYGRLGWVSPLALHYVAGLMTLVRARVAGTRCQVIGSDLHDLDAIPDPERCAISLVPTQLHRALDRPRTAARLGRFARILLGGAAAPDELLARARSAGLAVVTTYGMSETAGGCIHDGRPLPGVRVRIDAGDQRISLGGPMLFSGFVEPGVGLIGGPSDGWFTTNDRGRMDADRLQVLGRVDEVVISGGVNVDLAQVQRHVEGLIDRPACVVGVPDLEWGTRVVLVLEDGPSATELEPWRDRLAASGLARTALPRQLHLVERLPRTTSGKVDRQRLVTELGDPAQSSERPAPTSSPTASTSSA